MKVTLTPVPNPTCQKCIDTDGLCPHVYDNEAIDQILTDIDKTRMSLKSDIYKYNVYCLLTQTLKELKGMYDKA